ncbi:MAG: large-conductance mechanosensitive channel protein MscL [Alphaproteobacteria bacterium]|nr:large-conductance mechanosensitive channel protein MscL [Alphaproteobacteria bacterium]
MFKNLANEFKKFAMRGNVIDMAVGIIIGAAFGKIVDSLVKDVIMPPIGLLLGKVDFSNLFVVLRDGATPAPYNSLAAAQEAGAVTMNLGLFVNAIISFLIVAFAVFILIKAINELQAKMDKKEAQEVVKTTKACPYCCSEIPLNATRCPNCTSELKSEEVKGKSKKK